MIGRLSGQIGWRGTDQVLIDVGGVGYVVHVSERTLTALPPTGGTAMLWTEMLVREDLMQLFGFTTMREREYHRLLTSVQGIGARAALAILGALGADGVARAITLGDAAAIRSAPGVGAKLAARVVNELRDKAAHVMSLPSEPDPGQPVVTPAVPAPGAPPTPAGNPDAQSDALSALANLGYAPAEAARAVAEAADEAPGAESSTLIRAALRRLAPAG